jgi:DNA polymerase (family 10)
MTTHKNMTNSELVKLFRAIAAALSLEANDNRFRIIAYERAADSIEHATSEIKDVWEDNSLENLPGIGPNIASHLDELFKTGKVRHFEKILKSYPPAMFEILEIPGIGPKSAFRLCKDLGISKAHNAIKVLEKAAKKGHIASLEGFGADSQAKILDNIQVFLNRSHRLLLPHAEKIALEVIDWLTNCPEVIKVDPLGSLRRKASTVGDVDISVATNHSQRVIDHFTHYPKKLRVLEAGEHTASIILPNDYQVDLMVQSPESYGSLLQHFTGSKHHNIALREYAMKKDLSLSEYGIKTHQGLKTFSTEESFYQFLGLSYIPPELREDTGEIVAAQKNLLPELIELSDIKGDLQVHSSLDVEPSHDLGTSSLQQLIDKAIALNYEYLGLTEHNPSYSNHTSQQIYDLIKKKSDIIHQFNQSSEKAHEKIPYLFNGLEIDLLPDGKRAVPDNCLELLDYACVSIHSSFSQSKTAMTNRILKGLDHPQVRFLAHPTGRLLQQREEIEVDWDKIFDYCVTHDKWLEIDAWPNRLDLPDILVKQAIKNKVKLLVDTDSHSAEQLNYMIYGIYVARRGWVSKSSVVNTNPLTQMRELLISNNTTF